MVQLFGKIFIIIVIIIIVFMIAGYFKFFHDIEILWLPSQIGCSENYQCKYSEFHNACGNVEYKNFKGIEPYVGEIPACQCSFYVCMQK